MNKLFLSFIFLCSVGTTFAQNTFTAILKDEASKQPLVYANAVVEGTKIGGSSNTEGRVVIKNIPNGKHTIIFSYVGYRKKEKTYRFPLKDNQVITLYLEKNELLKLVTVVSTRTNNRIENIPTRVEVLGNEEVVEETGINPGNISKLLSETSGINVQHTSAVSGNVNFSVQGLPGKYTQLLKDGFPSYGGFASGLSLLQIPPLDLKQVEIIKGSASTLYGADAIAGIVNLISKKPGDEPEFSFLMNQTTHNGRDISSFFSGKSGKYGFTLLTGYNTQKPKDISNNGFADIPKYNRAVLSPTFFVDFDKNNKLNIGITTSYENRIGGNMKALKYESDTSHSFYEENKTNYLSGKINYTHDFTKNKRFTFRSNIANYSRTIKTNTSLFSGEQLSLFSEASYLLKNKKHSWVSGVNFYLTRFVQQAPSTKLFSINYSYKTVGIFTQDNWKLSKKLSLEPGIRYDYNLSQGGFLLPRLAILYRFSKKFSSRLSGGLGYKLPTPFTDESERTRYQYISFNSNLVAEKSMGTNLDFTFKTPLFDMFFLSFNQSFFMVQISNPIIANQDSLLNMKVYFENAHGNLLNKGMTSNLRLSMDELVLYVDYTFVDARKQYDQNKPLQLTPNSRLTTTLAYEDEEEGWKMALEAFYIGKQHLELSKQSPDYWLLGASIQKTIGHFTLALNVENILNIRQTKYGNIVHGNRNNPMFSELYAPLDGIVGNIVLKFDLY